MQGPLIIGIAEKWLVADMHGALLCNKHHLWHWKSRLVADYLAFAVVYPHHPSTDGRSVDLLGHSCANIRLRAAAIPSTLLRIYSEVRQHGDRTKKAVNSTQKNRL